MIRTIGDLRAALAGGRASTALAIDVYVDVADDTTRNYWERRPGRIEWCDASGRMLLEATQGGLPPNLLGLASSQGGQLMVASTCLRCGQSRFEEVEHTMGKSTYVVIQCAGCGGVVGVIAQAKPYLSRWSSLLGLRKTG